MVVVIVAACEGGSADPDADYDPTPDFDDSAARVDVIGHTSISATLCTEPRPWPYGVEPVIGSCRYSTLQPETCAPVCGVDQVCVGRVRRRAGAALGR